jgi:prepilin-type processing-associated H-X9-DG protein
VERSAPHGPSDRRSIVSTNAGGVGQTDFDGRGMYGMRSFHSGGANVALCDGSVRFLKSSTNMQVVWKLGSRAQGEIISADEY